MQVIPGDERLTAGSDMGSHVQGMCTLSTVHVFYFNCYQKNPSKSQLHISLFCITKEESLICRVMGNVEVGPWCYSSDSFMCMWER